MSPNKKRKYTFRKYTPTPYESGSVKHQMAKDDRILYRKTGNPMFEWAKVRKTAKKKVN